MYLPISVSNFYSILYFLFLYAFLGWCIETTYSTILRHKFINRGFLYGPVCPMYGLCACLLVIFLNPIKNTNILLLFISGVLITSFIEYFTGFALEKCFKRVWWDYSDKAFNLKGRISLLFSIVWGFLSVIFIKYIHPFFEIGLTYVHSNLGMIVLNILLLCILTDFTMTLISLVKLSTSISELILTLRTFQIELKSKIGSFKYSVTGTSDSIEKYKMEFKERYEEIIERIKKKHSRLLDAFPQYTIKKIDYIVEATKAKLATFNKH